METNVQELMNEIETFHKAYLKKNILEILAGLTSNELPEQAIDNFTNVFYNFMTLDGKLDVLEAQKEVAGTLAELDILLEACGISNCTEKQSAILHKALDDLDTFAHKAVAKFIISKFNPENKPLVINEEKALTAKERIRKEHARLLTEGIIELYSKFTDKTILPENENIQTIVNGFINLFREEEAIEVAFLDLTNQLEINELASEDSAGDAFNVADALSELVYLINVEVSKMYFEAQVKT